MVQARAERLEEQVKDLNEARKARQMYEDRMRVMEEQRGKAGEEKRAQKKKIEELEAQIASMGDVGDQLAEVRRHHPLHCSLHADRSLLCVLIYTRCNAVPANRRKRRQHSVRLKWNSSRRGCKLCRLKSRRRKVNPKSPSPWCAICRSPVCLLLLTYACSHLMHSCTGLVAQLIDNFQSIMGMQ
eukprot:COSAG02_NODE_5656_length_4148_cov_6.141512_2_plen_185_part_00